jgi:hypothetical protein
VTVISVNGSTVRLGFSAPRSTPIFRSELLHPPTTSTPSGGTAANPSGERPLEHEG